VFSSPKFRGAYVISKYSRRDLLNLASSIVPMLATGLPVKLLGFPSETGGDSSSAHHAFPDSDGSNVNASISDTFPVQAPALVREMVTVSHFSLKRVQELVDARPSLACAAWDWGFGDWETALGAASHMGNRAIAEYLLSKGARPSLFSATMLGQLDVVKAFVAAQPGVQRTRGPHSLSLLAHAKAGGQTAGSVTEFLQTLGDADADAPLPLSDIDTAALPGTYAFGPGATEQIEVTLDKRQGPMAMFSPLTWSRKGAMGRPLVPITGRVFYPAGAPSVRIRFVEDKGGMVMTVEDPQLVMTARMTRTST
jgi:hypothetical protein